MPFTKWLEGYQGPTQGDGSVIHQIVIGMEPAIILLLWQLRFGEI